MATNMYRVGDYVYFEESPANPYRIRRIEELNKTLNGNVEAKVTCFYRRRDLSTTLVTLADKHQSEIELEKEEDGFPVEEVSDKQRHQLKHRELFLSRQVETLSATYIRGKCMVTLLNEEEELLWYLDKKDVFFYSLVYDPVQKTLLADRGEIRVGSRYQADVPTEFVNVTPDARDLSEMEDLIWSIDHPLTDKQIDAFTIIARSVGTFARALDCASTVRQPSLHLTAAAASRDITLHRALCLLHANGYDFAHAVESLLPEGGLLLCRDEMEEWSPSEANLFEDATEKYGKDFFEVRKDFLPWKTVKSIVEYFYMWKTSDRYVTQKKAKLQENDSKLKQVYIPSYNKPNSLLLPPNSSITRNCESCYTNESAHWYSWGLSSVHCRLCSNCWIYWKHYGGLKMPTRVDGQRPAPDQRQERVQAQLQSIQSHHCGYENCEKEFRSRNQLARHLVQTHGVVIHSPSGGGSLMKGRVGFCLLTTPLTRIARRLCADLLRPIHAARYPFKAIPAATIKQECMSLLFSGDGHTAGVVYALAGQARLASGADGAWKRRSLTKRETILDWAGKHSGETGATPQWMIIEDGQVQPPANVAFPPLSPTSRQKFFPVDRISSQPSILRKRGYQEQAVSGGDGVPAKRSNIAVVSPVVQNSSAHNGNTSSGVNGHVGRIKASASNVAADTHSRLCFRAGEKAREIRKQKLDLKQLKKAARSPWKNL